MWYERLFIRTKCIYCGYDMISMDCVKRMFEVNAHAAFNKTPWLSLRG
jgi:hypothetical protein